MNLADVIYAPWALTDEAYATVQEVYARHQRGEKADLSAIEAAIGRPLDNARPASYDLVDGIATIHLDGVLGKRLNLFQAISGGTSTEIVRAQLRDALAASDVRGIILSIDSPGGTVDGTQQTADLVYAARDIKPIVAVGDGVAASAAYWIGTAASRFFLADATTMTGSVGIKGEHVDRSAADTAAGIKRTTLVAGKYKAVGDSTGPLTSDDRAILEARLADLYTQFVDDVARNLGLPADAVLAEIAEGRVFVGRAAVAAGAAHGIATVEQVRQRMIAGEFNSARSSRPAAKQERKTMTIEQLKAEHAELVAQIEKDAFAKGEASGHAAGLTAGAAAESARIQDVEAQALPGHEVLVASLKFDGKTTGAMAAIEILKAERAKMGDRHAALKTDAAEAAKAHQTAAPDGKPETAAPTASIEDQAKAEFEADAKVRDEFRTVAVYTAYRKAGAAGGIRSPRKG